MCSIDYDPPSLYVRTTRKARKQHKCSECRRSIEPGETYQHVAGVWDGGMSTYKTCQHCVAGQNLLIDKCGGFLHEGIEEDLVEHLHPSIKWSTQAARVVVGMRRKWKSFKGAGLMTAPVLQEAKNT